MTLCFCCVIFSEVKIQAGKLSTMHLSRKCCPSNLAALPSSLVGRKVREEAGFTRYRAARREGGSGLSGGSDGGVRKGDGRVIAAFRAFHSFPRD